MNLLTFKQWIVTTLEDGCSKMHFVTHHPPFVWLPIRNRHCLLAELSAVLDQRWQTGIWCPSDESADIKP